MGKFVRFLFCCMCAFLFAVCSYDPDEMISDYNGKFSSVNGVRIEEAGQKYLLDLFEKDEYHVEKGYQLDFEVKAGYQQYTWTLTGGPTASEYDISSTMQIAHINTNELRMEEGTYTLRLEVKNAYGIFYYDTAKIIVGDYR